MIRRILLTGALGALILAAAGATWVRLNPMEAADWHADPDAAERTGRPNDYLIAPGGDREPIVTEAGPGDLHKRLGDALARMPRTEPLDETVTDDAILATWVQRSQLMRYPDAISFKITPEGDGSRLVIWSRSRYGQSDLGVNRARIEDLLSDLDLG